MGQAPVRVHDLLEPVVTGLGYELVGIEYLRSGTRSVLRVYIDGPNGIGLEDCERVSHQVSGVLDVEDPIVGEYTLEVSSPGLDRPLYTQRDFERFAGHRARVRLRTPLDGRHKFKGTLQGVDGEHIKLVEDGMEFSLPWRDINKANLVPDS